MANLIKNIPWKMVGTIVLVLVGTVCVIGLMGLVGKEDDKQVCTSIQIVIEGKETFIDQQDIMKMIVQEYGKVEGRALNEIPIQRMEKSLASLPYVSKAEVHVDMDGTMKVNVQQRGISLRVINQKGADFYVDKEGKKIPTTLKYVPHVIVATGHIKESYDQPLQPVESDIVKDLVGIVKHVEGNALWENQIVQLYVDERQDIQIVPRVGDQEIVIGDAEDLEDKLGRIEVFYKSILPKVGNEAYSKVNVKYKGQIICERHDGWYIDSLQMSLKK